MDSCFFLIQFTFLEMLNGLHYYSAFQHRHITFIGFTMASYSPVHSHIYTPTGGRFNQFHVLVAWSGLAEVGRSETKELKRAHL